MSTFRDLTYFRGYCKHLPTSEPSMSLDDESTSIGVGPVELSLRDVESIPETLALFLWPSSPGTASFLLSTASECLLLFNLSDCSEDNASLPWLTLGFFGAADEGDGLGERVSRRFGGERFDSLSGEMSMGSCAVEDLGLAAPLLTPVKFGVLSLP